MIIERKKYYNFTKSSSDKMFEVGDSFYIDDDNETICITDNKGRWGEISKEEYENRTKDFEAVVDKNFEPVILLNTTGITWVDKRNIKIHEIGDSE